MADRQSGRERNYGCQFLRHTGRGTSAWICIHWTVTYWHNRNVSHTRTHTHTCMCAHTHTCTHSHTHNVYWLIYTLTHRFIIMYVTCANNYIIVPCCRLFVCFIPALILVANNTVKMKRVGMMLRLWSVASTINDDSSLNDLSQCIPVYIAVINTCYLTHM